MTAKQPLIRKKVLWRCTCLTIVLVATALWVFRWIEKTPEQCIRWRFVADDGRSFHGEIWFTQESTCSDQLEKKPWEGKLSNSSGLLAIYVPVDSDVPWYRKPFQNFRLLRRVPYRNGLISGSVIDLDQDGDETSIHQYRNGKENGIYCFLQADGSFSHLISYRNGMMDGPRIDCWTNGLLAYTDIFSNDVKTGLEREWSRTGVLTHEGEFAAYQPIGKHTYWFHHNGAKSHEILFSTNGVPIQTTIWASDGSCIGTGTYKDGEPWDGCFVIPGKRHASLEYYSNGTEVNYDNDWLNKAPATN